MSRRDSPIDLALFDMDDTVFDHTHSVRAGLTALRRIVPFPARLSLEAIAAEYQRLLDEVHPSVLAGRLSYEQARLWRLTRLAGWAGVPIDRPRATELSVRFRAAYQRAVRAVPGVTEVLDRVVEGARMGIVSNNAQSEQVGKLRALGLEERFDFVLTSEMARVQKPDPQIFRMALKRIGATPRRSVMVGDSWEWDIVGAKAAGIRGVWLNRFGADRPETPDVQVIPSFRPKERAVSAIFEARAPAGTAGE